jgi:carboxypeptidase Taq
MVSPTYQEFVSQLQKMADLSSAIGLLQWDSEVYLPEDASALRGRQVALLTGIVHQEATSKQFGQLMNGLANEKLPLKHKTNVALALKSYNRDKKFNKDFVMKKSLAVSEAFNAWSRAKTANDFSVYAPYLDKLLNLSREEVKILGYKDHPYDAMIDLYERNMNVKTLDRIFDDVKKHIVPLAESQSSKQKLNHTFLQKKYDHKAQFDFTVKLLKDIGYDFKKGRQDISLHPFTIGLNPNDVRVTTRIDESDICNSIWSSIHEGGHALYEQGLNIKEYGLASGAAASLAIHESQSRFWENNIGRSIAFWKYQLPKLKKAFPSQLQGVNINHFFEAINFVKPNLIRTEADELHYHIHIMIRYEIEKEIFTSNIKANDLKPLWNELYKKYIGIKVPNDKNGILQDVHWSHGSFGYFPTYSLGSFYAAQFYATLKNRLPSIEDEISKGNLTSVNTWLQDNIYKHGGTYDAETLCKKVTGSTLDLSYFITYVKNKFKIN